MSDFKLAIEQAGFEGTDADVKALRAELKKAEAALKRSKTKDYYKILGKCQYVDFVLWLPDLFFAGIPRDCSEPEIKKAYRRESLKHHPDKVGLRHLFMDVST